MTPKAAEPGVARERAATSALKAGFESARRVNLDVMDRSEKNVAQGNLENACFPV